MFKARFLRTLPTAAFLAVVLAVNSHAIGGTLSPAPFSAMGVSSITANWGTTYNPGTVYYLALSTANNPGAIIQTTSTINSSFIFSGLNANTTVYAFVSTDSMTGYIQTDVAATLAAPPTSAAFAGVSYSSAALSWLGGINPAWTTYEYELSVSSGFGALASSGSVVDVTGWLTGLSEGTTYYGRVRAVNNNGIGTAYAYTPGGAQTQVHQSSAPANTLIPAPFDPVGITTLRENWGSTFSSGTVYYVALTSATDPGSVVGTSATLNTYCDFSGLRANTTYYGYVSTMNGSGYQPTATGVTLATAPASAVFAGIWYSSAVFNWGGGINPVGTPYEYELSVLPGFDTLEASGYSTDLTTLFAGLTEGTTYYARVRAVNNNGVFTAYANTPGLAVTLVHESSAPVNTLTPAAFSAVSTGALTMNWGTTFNPGTLYYVALTTATNPGAVALTGATTNSSYDFSGLSPNITYYGYVSTTSTSGYMPSGTGATLAAAPASASFAGIWYSSAVLSWLDGINPGWTSYEYELSLSPSFGAIAASGSGTGLNGLLNGLSQGTVYYGRVRAVNTDGASSPYVSAPGTGLTLGEHVDAPPTAGITWPADNSMLNTLPELEGTAADDVEVSSVAVKITRLSDGYAWDSSTWTAAPAWLDADLAGAAWTYTGVPAWTSGQNYRVTARARDSSGSWSVEYATSVFVYDAVAPVSAVTQPENGAHAAFTSIAGTASDAFGVSHVLVAVQRWSDAKYWDGSGWTAGAAWSMAAGSTTWLYTDITSAALTDGATYLVMSQAYDAAGNTSDTNWGSSTFTYIAVRTFVPGSWSAKTSMPTARAGCQSGVMNGRLYVAAGTAGGPPGITNALEMYDPGVNGWSAKAPMNYPEYSGAGGVIDNKLYIIGGWDTDTPNGALKIYDSASNSWSTGASLPGIYSGGGGDLNGSITAAVVNRKFYLLVGSNGDSGYYKYFYVYDPDADSWAGRSSPVDIHEGAGITAYNGKVYVFGGNDGDEIGNTVEAYDPGGDNWTSLASMPTARWNSRAEVVGDKIFVLGGNDGSEDLDTVEVYDPGADTWAYGAPMPVANSSFASGVINGLIYVTGGDTTALNVFAAGTILNPSAGSVGYSSMTVTWASKAGADYATALFSDSLYNSVVSSVTISPNSEAFTGLAPNTGYYFEVKLSTETDYSYFVNRVSTYTLAAIPAAASQPFTGVSSASLTLNWDADGNPAGTLYHAQLSTSPSFASANISSYTYSTTVPFGGLPAGTVYYARAAAQNAAGIWTGYAALGSTMTVAPSLSPALFSAVGISSLTVNWGTTFSTGTQYYVGLSTAPDFGAFVSSGSTANTVYQFGGLSVNTTYYGYVSTASGSGYILAGTGSTLAVAPSTAVFAGVWLSSAALGWQAGINPGWTMYQYELSVSSGFGEIAASGSGTGTAGWLTGLAEGTAYYGRVRAWNNDGMATPYAYVPTPAVTPVSAISSGTLSAAVFSGTGVNSLTVNWGTTYSPGTLYYVSLSTMSDANIHAAAASTTDPFYYFTGLTANTTYYGYVSTASGSGYIPTGSGATFIETPVSVEAFDIFAASLTAVVTAPAFTHVNYGLSGVAVAINNVYQSWRNVTAFPFSALIPNTQYDLKAKARNQAGVETAESVVVSTYTLAVIAQSTGPALTNILTSNITVNWSSGTPAVGFNGPGATYKVQFSTAPDFSAASVISATDAQQLSVDNLLSNTTYYFRAQVYNAAGATDSSWLALGSTRTMALPVNDISGLAFSDLEEGALTVNWDTTFSTNTLYYVALATIASPGSRMAFGATNGSSYVFSGGLEANTKYYGFVSTMSASGFVPAGSGATLIETPAGVDFAGIGTTTIAASAYAPVFTGLGAGLSGVAVAINNAYSSWNSTVTVAFPALKPNTQYAFKAKARNQDGRETAESVVVSTYTLAAVVLSTGPAFKDVFTSSVTVSWSSGTAAGGFNGPGAAYTVQASTAPDFSAVAFSSTTPDPWLSVPGLSAGTAYYFRAQVYNAAGVTDYSWLALGSTTTAALPPGIISPAQFGDVGISSLTVNWGTTFSEGAIYYVSLSTVASPGAALLSAETIDTFYNFSGLNANTTYYGYVSTTSGSGYLLTGSEATLAEAPASAAFGGVWYSSAALNWPGGANPSWTLYQYELSVSPGFDTLASSGSVKGLTGFLAGLTQGTTYYGRVRAVNISGADTPYVYVPDAAQTPVHGAPSIISLTADPASILPFGVSSITCVATPPQNDSITYTWTAGSGTIIGSGSNIAWTAPGSTGTYAITCQVLSGFGGSVQNNVPVTVALDNPPAARIVQPQNNSAVNALPQISGTAWDDVSVSSVALTITRFADNYYWTSSSWTPAQTWLYMPGGPAWSFNSVPSWLTNSSYTVTAKARDNAGNWSVVYSTSVFTYDNTLPVSAVNEPASGSYLQVFSRISGASSDAGGVAQVQVAVTRWSDGSYWDGDSWTPGPAWNLASGTTSWAYTAISSAALTEGTTYEAMSRAYDPAGNISAISDSTFTYIGLPPAVAIVQPPDNSLRNSLAQLSGTAADDVSVSTVILTISRSSDNNYWNGSAWVPGQTWLSAVVAGSAWTFAGVPAWVDNSSYTVVAKAADNSGNWSPVYSTSAFTYDGAAPLVGVVKPLDGRYYGANAAQPGYILDLLSGTASDASGIAKTEIRLYDVNAGAYLHAAGWVVGVSSWQAAGKEAWQYTPPALTDGDKYRLEARAFDLAGNLSAFATSYFYYDAAKPAVSLVTPDVTGFLNSLPQLTGQATDLAGGAYKSGLLGAQVAIQSGGYWWDGSAFASASRVWLGDSGHTWPDWNLTGVSTPTWVSNTLYHVEAQAMDVARNTSTIVTQDFVYDTQAPVSSVTTPSGANGYLGSLAYIRGTSADSNNLGMIKEADLRVKALTGPDAGKYWRWGTLLFDGPSAALAWYVASTTQAYAAWYSTGTPPGAPGGITLANGVSYEINSRALDKAGNYSPVYSTSTFTYDVSKPTGTFTTLAGSGFGAYQRIINPLAGSSFDGPAGGAAGLDLLGNDGVQLRILEKGSGKWWNNGVGAFSNTDGSAAWFDANGGSTTSWTYTHAGLDAALNSGGVYLVQYRGRDTASPANVGPSSNGLDSNFTLGVDSVVFTVDKSSPVSRVTFPASGSNLSAVPAITGTAQDALSGIAGAANISMSIQEVSPGTAYWNGVLPGTFTALTETFYPLSALGGTYDGFNWSVSTPAFRDGYTYSIRLRARDNAQPGGNLETAVSSITFTYDITPPAVGIVRPVNGSIFNYTSTTAVVNYSDVGGSGLNFANFVVKLDGVAVSSGAITVYASSAAVQLAGLTQAAHTLDAYIRDNAGNLTNAVPAGFTVDLASPTASITRPANGAFFNYTSTTVLVNYADAGGSGLKAGSLVVKLDGVAVSTGLITVYASSASAQLTGLTQAAHTLDAAISDNAGNLTNAAQTGFTVDLSSPTVSIARPANGVFFNYPSTTVVINYADTGGAGLNPASLVIKLDGAAVSTGTIVVYTSSATAQLAGLTSAAHTLDAFIRDNAGNLTNAAQAAFTTDLSSPTVSIVRPASGVSFNYTSTTAVINYGDTGSSGLNLASFVVKLDGVTVAPGAIAVYASSATAQLAGLTQAVHTLDASILDNAGNQASAAQAGFTVDFTPPSAAADLAAAAVSSGAISLTWTAPGDDGAAGTLNNSTFTIQYSSDIAVAWSTSAAQVNISTTAVNPGTVRKYALGGLLVNTSYYFRLWTRDDTGNYSSLSNGAAAATLIEAPASVTFAVSSSAVTSFAFPSSYTGLGTGMSGVAFAINNVYGAWLGVAQASFAALTPNTQYVFKAKARNLAGVETAESAAVSTCTLAEIPSAAAFAGVGYSSAALSWQTGANPGGTTYQYEMSVSSMFTSIAASGSGTAAPAWVNGLAEGGLYYGRVRAVNNDGLPTAYAYAAGTVVTLVHASAPTGVAAGISGSAIGTSSINWTWNAGTVVSANYFAIYSPGGVFIATVPFNASGSYAQVALATNTAYAVSVGGRNDAGDGPLAASATVYTLAAAPTNTAAALVSSRAVHISWNTNGNPAGTVYQLWESVDASAYGLLVSTTGMYTRTGLLDATTYYYKVRALNADGFPTAYSAAASTRTTDGILQAAPAGAGAAASTDGILWTWNAVAGATGYRVLNAAYSSVSGSLSTGTFSWLETGLSSNTAYTRYVNAYNGVSVTTSAAVTVYTLAAAPSGFSAAHVYISSAVLAWGLNGNAAGTTAQVRRWTDTAAYSDVFEGAALAFADTTLAECSTYYFQVRNRNGGGLYSAYASTVTFATLASTPASPGGLSAESLAGGFISLAWNFSPSAGVTKYNLYYDNGTSTIDYHSPLHVFAYNESSWTTAALTAGTVYKFGLRAVTRCGIEEQNTTVFASAQAMGSLTGIRAAIKVPQTGKRVNGNRVNIVAEMILGTPELARQVLFQYRVLGSAAWLNIPAASANHQNPDTDSPYFVHWNVAALPQGAVYELRAVATGVDDAVDPAPPTITVVVDHVNPDTTESDLSGEQQSASSINNAVTNTVQAGDTETPLLVKVSLPADSLNSQTVVLTMVNNPASQPPPPVGVQNMDLSVKIHLSNEQHDLSNGHTATITLSYSDDNDDDIIDGTSVRVDQLKLYYSSTEAGPWLLLDSASPVIDRARHTISGTTSHFSFFAVFAGLAAANLDGVRVYPVPYLPDDGKTDNGVPYSASDAQSGIIFDKLPSAVRIKIFTLSGQLVTDYDTLNSNGKIQWDVRNNKGKDAASGAYIAVISSPGNKTVVKKLLVVR